MYKKIFITLSIGFSLVLIWGALGTGNNEAPIQNIQAVREENGIQYIRILARGGYRPNQITAKANIPTILEVETKGTYDCSAALTIPQLGYQQFLKPTGITKIEVPKNLAINSIDFVCSMGMFSSSIDFVS